MAAGADPRGCDQYNSLHEKLVAAFAAVCAQPARPDAFRRHARTARGPGHGRIPARLRRAGRARRALHVYRGDRPLVRRALLRRRRRSRSRPCSSSIRGNGCSGERYAPYLAGSGCRFVEPPWKALLSNKGLLRLPLGDGARASRTSCPPSSRGIRGSALGPRNVRKPLYSREGANVTLMRRGDRARQRGGPYGQRASCCRTPPQPPTFDGRYPVLGSWLVASRPCGLGIREDPTPITKQHLTLRAAFHRGLDV